MTAIRGALESNRPFRLRTGDGAVVSVPTPDHALMNPTGRLVIVFDHQDGAQLLDVALITAVEYEKAPAGLGN